MMVRNVMRAAILSGLVLTLASCGGPGLGGRGFLSGTSGILSGDSGLFRKRQAPTAEEQEARAEAQVRQKGVVENVVTKPRSRTESAARNQGRGRVLDLFRRNDDTNTSVAVNRFLWQASLEVLDFLPIQSVDPFSGVIVTGFGTPPGGGRAYRATIYVQDPALDARSLKVALMTNAGPVDPATARAVEDAILTRARELRIRAGRL